MTPRPMAGAACKEGREGAAVALRGHGQPEGLADRRECVHGLGVLRHRAAAPGVAGRPWVADDEGQVVARVEEPGLGEQPVVPKLLAVVGGENDEGAVPLPARPQELEERAELRVHLRTAGPVLPPQRVELPLLRRRRTRLGQYPIAIALRSTAKPLYTRFPIIFSSCFSKVKNWIYPYACPGAAELVREPRVRRRLRLSHGR
jgi:hypothetical protein